MFLREYTAPDSWRKVAIGFVILVAFACSGGTESTEPTSILGSYALTTINGQQLPYDSPCDGTGTCFIRYLSGSVTLTAIAEVTHVTQDIFSGRVLAPEIDTWTATYQRNGSQIALTDELGHQYFLTLSGNRLSGVLTGATDVNVYIRP